MQKLNRAVRWAMAFSAAVLLSTAFMRPFAAAQGQDGDDPPSRVARLGYMQGSVSDRKSVV